MGWFRWSPVVLEFWDSFLTHPTLPSPTVNLTPILITQFHLKQRTSAKSHWLAEMRIPPKKLHFPDWFQFPFETAHTCTFIPLWHKRNRIAQITDHSTTITQVPVLHYISITLAGADTIYAHLSSLSFLDTILHQFPSNLFRLYLFVLLSLGYFINSMNNGVPLPLSYTLPSSSKLFFDTSRFM